MKKYNIYYRVWDGQRGDYFGTGYNATSMIELIKNFQSYICIADEVAKNQVNSWKKIADWLQQVTLEKSNKPFEEYDN